MEFDNNIESWVGTILANASSKYINFGQDENYHYLPEFQNIFLKFMRTFVLWSCILTTHYSISTKTSSSAIVESYFNNLKTLSLKQYNLPMRIDKFLSFHLNDIHGRINLAYYNKTDNIEKDEEDEVSKQIKTDIEENVDTKVCIEDWKGLGKAKKRVRTSYYGVPCPEILNIIDGKKIKLGLMKNGNSISKPVTFNNQKYLVFNTCPFDSLFQIIMVAYCDSFSYKNILCEFDLLDLIKLFAQYGTQNIEIYKERVRVLSSVVSSDKIKVGITGIISIDSESNVCNLTEKIFFDYPSVKLTKSCSRNGCTRKKTERSLIFFPLNRQIILDEGIEFLQNAVVDIEDMNANEHLCNTNNCSNSLVTSFNMTDHLFFEFDEMRSVSLDKIPIILKIQNKTFYLRGAVHYIGSISSHPNTIGHYVAYCRRMDAMWELFDDQKTKYMNCRKDIIITPHLLMYTV